MSVKIYRPTDSLQVYVQENGIDVNPKLVTGSHLRIYTTPQDTLMIKDELLNKTVVDNTAIADIQDEGGAPIGATLTDALSYLDKIIG